MAAYSGIIPPVVTPLNPDGSVDYASLDRVVDHLLDNGMDGLFVLGSTGEVAYLTDEQRVNIVEAVAKRVQGRVPLIVGCMETTAPRVINLAQRMVAAGAQAIVVTAPFYALNSREEIAEHFRLIASQVSVPVFAYDVPVRLGGVKLDPELLVRLGTEGVIVGVKDSSGNDVSFRRLIALNQAAGSPLALFTGHETVNEFMMLAGADGQVPGFANVDPGSYRQLADAVAAGDWAQAIEIQERINARFEIVFKAVGHGGDATGVGAFKMAMYLLGLIDHPSLPAQLGSFSESDVAAVRQVLIETGMLK